MDHRHHSGNRVWLDLVVVEVAIPPESAVLRVSFDYSKEKAKACFCDESDSPLAG